MDYTFSNWTTYYLALTECMKNDDFEKLYPKYARYQDDTSWSEVKIIEELLKAGQDPQEGLDGFIKALEDEPQYVRGVITDIKPYVKIFMEAGAKPNAECLFSLKYPDERYFKKEVRWRYENRARLIDAFVENGVDLNEYKKYYDWASLGQGKTWQSVDRSMIEEDYQKACYMVLKYSSDSLYSLKS